MLEYYIDTNFIRRVKDYMKPQRKAIKNYDEILPIILIDTGGIT